MSEIISFSSLPNNLEGLSLCLGDFDGFHKGHRELLKKARELGKSAVLLFDVDPSLLLGKKRHIITDLSDRIAILSALEIEYIIIIHVDEDLINLTPEEFIDKVLKKINPKYLIVGEDFRFGKFAKGDADALKECFNVIKIPLLYKDGEKISSTSIKKLLKEGKIVEANNLLDGAYTLKGKVVEGFHNGRKIGFPTINLSLSSPYILPKNGVYFGKAYLKNKEYDAIINVGKNPTIGKLDKDIVEAHLLDFDEEAYGEIASISFLFYRRDEARFSSLDKLKDQLEADLLALKELFVQ